MDSWIKNQEEVFNRGLELGQKRATERIIKRLERRCLFLIHRDLLAEADELRTQIALIKGEK